jgi:hypothetical protein
MRSDRKAITCPRRGCNITTIAAIKGTHIDATGTGFT